jgi:hypothetical protein
VAPDEFSFACECSDPKASREMLCDLVTQVLNHAGCSADAVRTAVAGVESTVAAHKGQVGVKFRAHGGSVSIVLSSGDNPIWQTSCPAG